MTYNGYVLPRLIPGTLVQRYKRFLADVILETGETVTAHCPNTGSMRGCCEPGKKVYLSESDNPRRKLAYTWELMELPETLIGINTQIPILKAGVEILVATPGRLLDHVQNKTLMLNQVNTLVLDEADRMLDMGFMPDLKRIIALLPDSGERYLSTWLFGS